MEMGDAKIQSASVLCLQVSSKLGQTHSEGKGRSGDRVRNPAVRGGSDDRVGVGNVSSGREGCKSGKRTMLALPPRTTSHTSSFRRETEKKEELLRFAYSLR
jgi:hypothetical protein